MSLRKPTEYQAIDDEMHAQAGRILERWRERGFDMVICYRSGYCVPASSGVLRAELPAGYRSFAIDASGAVEALVVSISSGDVYRL